MNERMAQHGSGFFSLQRAPDRQLELGVVPLLMGLALMYLGMFVGQVVAVAAVAGAALTNGAELQVEQLTTRQQAIILMAGQLGGVVALIVFLTVFWRFNFDMPTSRFWRRMGVLPYTLNEFGLAAGGVLVLLFLYVNVAIITILISKWLGMDSPKVGHVMLEMMQQTQSTTDLTLLIVVAVVLAPICEEIAFRGFVQTAILNLWGPNPGVLQHWMAIIITSIVFAVPHMPSVAWQALPGLVVVGLVLGWLYERTGSLLAPILVHMAFNGLMVLATIWLTSSAPVAP